MGKFRWLKRGLAWLGAACAAYVILGTTLPFIIHREVSEEYKNKIEEIDVLGEGPGTEQTALIKDNTEALVLRLQMMEKADKEIIMSTFDFDEDEAGRDVMASLLHAAQRGVKVKLLVDGLSGFMDVYRGDYFHALALHKNVELKIYCPLTLLKPWELQTRLHDKYLIIDDKMYLLGGRNSNNLFLGNYQEHQNIDTELFVYETDPVEKGSLRQVKEYFEQIWALPESRLFEPGRKSADVLKAYEELTGRWNELLEAYPQAAKEPDWEEMTFAVNKITLFTNPVTAQNKEPWLWYALHKLMLTGERVMIHTPYIICSSEMYSDLKTLCESAKAVEIITNDVSSGANPWGCTDYLNEKENILATGVTVHEYLGEQSNHIKSVIIDDRISVIGSYNLDMRSTYLDTEMMLVIDSDRLNSIMKEEALVQIASCKTVVQNAEAVYGPEYQERSLSTGKKISYAVMRVLIRAIRYLL